MKYADALANLNSRILMPKTAPGIIKIQRALERLNLRYPRNGSNTLVIAGTNGKGGVCRSLEHFFAKAGLKTHLFTSPHLVNVRERIRIGETPIDEESFAQAFEHINSLTQDLDLSHFETLVTLTAWLFYQNPPSPEDWFIWEVGLGGTWDATNAIPHSHAVITALGFDHQDLLGDSLIEIAKNKFGIFGPGNDVYCLANYPIEIRDLLASEVRRLNLDLHVAPEWDYQCDPGFPLPKETLVSRWGDIPLPIPGRHFAENLNLSLHILDALEIDISLGLRDLHELYWPGRMDVLQLPTSLGSLMLSGDHNPMGVRALKKTLSSIEYDQIFVLAGVGKNKDRSGILSELSSVPRSQLILTRSPFQGCDQKDFSEWLQAGRGYIEEPIQALTMLLNKCGHRDLVIVTGSLYLVGEIYTHALKADWLPQNKRGFFCD